jgi:hypothetical protein
VLAFRDVAEAAEGIAAINSDYDAHRASARRIAEEYFSSELVLPILVAQATD